MPTSPYTNGIMPSFGVTVPPGDALNTTDADIKGGLQPTFFADGCRFYVEAASVNGIISEILNAVNCMDLEYDPNRLDNLCLAIKAATQPPNAETIVASICAVPAAQVNLANCLITEIVAALCANAEGSRQAFVDCLFTNTLNTPEMVVSCILSDGVDNGGRAAQTLALGIAGFLISADTGNTLDVGSDGGLFAPGGGGAVDTATLWTIRVGVGQVYLIDENMGAGAERPPQAWNATGPVFIKLTSSDAFNNGNRVINYTTTGGQDATKIVTGQINVPGPLMGRVVHMLNSEQAILRPREINGQLQQDQMQWHEHNCAGGSGGFAVLPTGGAGQFNLYGGSDSNGANLVAQNGNCPPTKYEYQADSENVRTGVETRMKNLGVTAYMRVR